MSQGCSILGDTWTWNGAHGWIPLALVAFLEERPLLVNGEDNGCD